MNKTKQTNAFCGVIPNSLNIELAVTEFDRHLARLAYHLQKMILYISKNFIRMRNASENKSSVPLAVCNLHCNWNLKYINQGFFPFFEKNKNRLQLFGTKVIKQA